jgi:hypothetical protein
MRFDRFRSWWVVWTYFALWIVAIIVLAVMDI